MSHEAGLEGPEYVSVFADRLHANGQDLEAKLFHELARAWSQDRRTIAQLHSEASAAPNVGHEELAQLRAHSLAFSAIQAFRERATQLIPAANLREVHWIEALMDGLVQARLLLADHLRHPVDPGDDEDDGRSPHEDLDGVVWRVEDGRVVWLAPDATDAEREEAQSYATAQSGAPVIHRRIPELEGMLSAAANRIETAGVAGPITAVQCGDKRIEYGPRDLTIEISAQSDFTVEQEDAILARGLAAYNALHPQAPLDPTRALALIAMIECAKRVVASEAPAASTLQAAA